MEENPVQEAIKWLQNCGWTLEESENIVRSVKDKDAERLFDIAPMWIEHCGNAKQYVEGLLGTVALGLVAVKRSDEGLWVFELNDTGLKAARQIAGGNYVSE